ncbi:MAG: FAD-binding oxidoreductase [Proteobacteria bacterium]|jgi:FAD/FMN-containing dehydrogenase|nr:FAD-binding oxidoreductase [Pseudomonadota bacterium]
MNRKQMRPWGRLAHHKQTATRIDAEPQLQAYLQNSGLAIGFGRSYGDSGVAQSGKAWAISELNDIESFDPQTGRLVCAAGVSLGEILNRTLTQGWSLPVSPGTQFVSVAGAIANDVHGKNHHRTGTFGRHVLNFELLRSSGEKLLCSPTQNTDWYGATIGGLGLTGVITKAEIQLTQAPSAHLNVVVKPYQNLVEFFALGNELNDDYDYTVAWFDCAAKGDSLGRGIYYVANPAGAESGFEQAKRWSISVPITPPLSLVNRPTIGLYNKYYYWKQSKLANTQTTQSLEQYLYPLDAIKHWNRIYGPKGFQQYQCVVPTGNQQDAIREIVTEISKSGVGSFLAVLKTFGNIVSPGLLSFPMGGTTLALDFPQSNTLKPLFDRLDSIVSNANGRLYPAKDAHMSATHFQKFYPEWQQLEAMRDPNIMSLFWQRVTT